MSNIQLLQGDCIEMMNRIPNKSVDLVIADPPYKVETTGGGLAKRRDFYHEIDFMSNGFSDNVLDMLCEKMKHINIYLFCSKKTVVAVDRVF